MSAKPLLTKNLGDHQGASGNKQLHSDLHSCIGTLGTKDRRKLFWLMSVEIHANTATSPGLHVAAVCLSWPAAKMSITRGVLLTTRKSTPNQENFGKAKVSQFNAPGSCKHAEAFP